MSFNLSEKLALQGGPKAKRTPFPQRKRHGDLEKRYLSEVIDADVVPAFPMQVFLASATLAQAPGLITTVLPSALRL